MRAQPLVRECWMLSGEIDFILKCVAPDLAAFQAFVAELTAAPHVRNVKTSLTLRNSKERRWCRWRPAGQSDAELGLAVGARAYRHSTFRTS